MRGVNHRFELEGAALPVLDNIDLDIQPGEFVALLGPSGCGKSTLLRLVAGLEPPAEGALLADGEPIAGPSPSRIVVFQDPTLYPWRTVRNNVALGLQARGLLKTQGARVDDALQRVGLQAFGQAYPHQLSGGMAQRAALARALVNDPRILILDEPLGKLDSLTRIAMQSELVDLWQRAGFTALLVTHDVEEALFMATRIVVLSERPARIRTRSSMTCRIRVIGAIRSWRRCGIAPWRCWAWTRRGEYRGDGAGGRGGASGHAGLVAGRPGGRRRGGRARLAWASAWTLAGVAGLVALGWSRAQGLPGLLGSRAGHLALASSAALALALAAAWLWRREADTDSHDGKPARRGAVLAAGALALLALLLGQGFAWQGGESLAVAHWPFAWRYDADLPVSPHTWRRLAWAGAQMASAVLLALAAWRWRRWRIALSLAAIALGASVSWPHPRMLLTEARATSYQHSPLPFSDRELLRGAALYQAHCASCHGRARTDAACARPALAQRAGSGPVRQPAGGRAALARGAWRRRAAGPAMPAFGALSDDDIWRVLDYLRLQAYGLSGGAGMPAVPAPAVALSCRDGRAAWLTDLRGLPVRVLAQAPGASPEPQDPRLLTVALSRDGAPVADADCVATGPQAWAAYALAAGLPEDGLAGAQFMVDRRGWLRARRLPGAAPAWTSADNVCGPDGRMENARPRAWASCWALWTASPSPFPISGALRRIRPSMRVTRIVPEQAPRQKP